MHGQGCATAPTVPGLIVLQPSGWYRNATAAQQHPQAKCKASGPLSLDALEVFDEDEEIPTDHFLADRAAATHLPKALAPDGHLSTTMGREDGPAIDKRGNLSDGEMSPMLLGNARQIGWRRTERGRGWAIAAAGQAVARATVAQKVLLPRAHRGSRDGRRLLCSQGERDEYPPQDHHTETPALHTLPPRKSPLLSVRQSATADTIGHAPMPPLA